MDEKISTLQHLIDDSQYTVVVTGAGVSMASGILDMEHMNTLQAIQTSMGSIVKISPERSYKILQKSFLKAMFDIGPSKTHKKLAELEKAGKIQGIVTTNIDCLHKIAGSKKVAEIQGSYGINKCLKCGYQYNDVNIWNSGKAPRCQECNGVIVSHPVYSHISVFEEDYSKAVNWISNADLVIVVGSKGMYGSYFNYLKAYAKIVQINPKRTHFDDMATLNIKKEADEVFQLLS